MAGGSEAKDLLNRLMAATPEQAPIATKDEDTEAEDLLNRLAPPPRPGMPVFAVTSSGNAQAAAARVWNVSRKMGLPFEVVGANIDEFAQISAQRDFDPDVFARTSPVVARFMSENPTHGFAVQQDANKLGWVERQLKAIGQRSEVGRMQTELADLSYRAMMGEKLSQQESDRRASLRAAISEHALWDIKAASGVKPFEYLAEQIPQLIEGAKAAFSFAPTLGMAGAVAGSAFPLLGTVAGTFAGTSLGLTTGFAYSAGKQSGALAYDNAISSGASESTARAVGLGNAAFVGATEAVGFKILSKLIPGLRGLVGPAAVQRATSTPAAQELLGKYGQVVAKNVLKRSLPATTSRLVTEKVKGLSTAMLADGTIEIVQNHSDRAGQVIAEMDASGEIDKATPGTSRIVKVLGRILDDATSPEAFAEDIEAFKAAASVTGLLGGFGSTLSLRGDVKQMRIENRRASLIAQNMREAINTVKETKVFASSPGIVRQLVRDISGNERGSMVYLSLEKWDDEAKRQGFDPATGAVVIGFEDSYKKAVDNPGTDIAIPAEDYIEWVAKGKLGDELNNHIKLSPDEFSQAESEQALDEAEQAKIPVAEEQATPVQEARDFVDVAIDAAQRDYISGLPEDMIANRDLLERWKQINVEGRAAVEQSVILRLQDKVTKQLKRRNRQEISAVREQVEREVDDRPEYIALNALKLGSYTMRNDQKIDGLKIDKSSITKTYGKDALKGLPRGITVAKGGFSVDDLAAMFGYADGAEMLHQFKTMEPRDRLIERTTIERSGLQGVADVDMSEVYDIAIRSFHDAEARGKLLEEQLKYIVSQEFATHKKIAHRLARSIRPIAEVKAESQAHIESLSLRELNPKVYLRAEKKAMQEAVDAYARGDFQGMYDAKLNERRNLELYRAATRAKDLIASAEQLNDRLNGDNSRKAIGRAPNILENIDALRERVGFDVKRSLANQRRVGLTALVLDLADTQGIPVEIDEEVLAENPVNFDTMTVGQMRSFYNAIKSLAHVGRVLSGDIKLGLDYNTLVAKGELVESVTRNSLHRGSDPDAAPGAIRAAKDTAKSLASSLKKIEFMAEQLDGDLAGGVVWHRIYKPVLDSQDMKTLKSIKAQKSLDKLFKDAYTRVERNKFYFGKKYYPELGMSANKANLLTIALNWGNDGNRDAILKGYAKLGWTEEGVQSLLDRELDARDAKFVQSVWDYLDTFWEPISEMHRRYTGIVPERIQARNASIGGVTVPGGYYPIVTTKNQSLVTGKAGRAQVDEQARSVKEVFGVGGMGAMTRHGHLKARKGSTAALDLTFNGLKYHVNNVVHDLAFRPAVIEIGALLRDNEISGAIRESAGSADYNELMPWLQSVAASNTNNYIHEFDSLLGRGRINVTSMVLGFKAMTGLIQVSGYPFSAKELGPVYALKGLWDVYTNPLNVFKTYKEVTKHSVMMRTRMSGSYNRDVSEFVSNLQIPGTHFGALRWTQDRVDSARSSLFQFIALADMSVSLPTWKGAYAKAFNGDVDLVSPGDHDAAVAFADRTVRITQGSGLTQDLARVQRGTQSWKLFLMFYQFWSVAFNQYAKTSREYIRTHDEAQVIASLAMLWILPLAMEMAIRGELKGPDDFEEESEMLKFYAKKIAYYPASSVPILRDAIAVAEHGSDRSTSATIQVAMDAIEGVKAIPGVVEMVAAGEQEEIKRTDLKNILNIPGLLIGFPSNQAFLTAEGLYRWRTGEVVPEGPLEAVKQVVTHGARPEQ